MQDQKKGYLMNWTATITFAWADDLTSYGLIGTSKINLLWLVSEPLKIVGFQPTPEQKGLNS